MKISNLLKANKLFMKYVFFAGLSFIIDITLFHIIKLILNNKLALTTVTLTATYVARAISSLFNYFVNRNSVFKKEDGTSFDKRTIFKYYLLVIVQATVSGLLVNTLSKYINISATFIKVPVECAIFIVNFIVQRYFIFTDKPRKLIQNENIRAIIFGILCTFSLQIDLSKKNVIEIHKTNSNVLSYLILSIFLIFFYKKYNNKYKKNTLFSILASVFSILMVFGYSYDCIGSTYLVFGHIGFILISIIKFICFYILFNIFINIIYNLMCEYKIKDIIKKNKLISLFNKHPFIFCFIAIFICYIPYYIAFYPAVMGYDPSNQIREFMGMHTRYMDSVILIDPNMTITNFNPVIHTLLLGGCFKLGHLIGNDNIGLFLYVVIQSIIVLSTLSYSIVYMKKRGVTNKLLFIVLGMYALIPVFPFYTITTNKDTIFCCFVLLYCIKLYDLIVSNQNIKKYISFFFIMLFVTLTRNNGIYTIMLSLPFGLIWLKDKRKSIVILICAIVICYIGYNKIVLTSFKISNTSTREMLSLPFQQTARLAKYYPESFSEEDKEIIDKILTFETLGKRYNSQLSDPVKNEYNIYTTSEDLKKYFGVWAKGLIKHPDVYIDSTINNIYGYFYPDTSSWYIYYKYNTKLKQSGFSYHYNSFKELRSILSSFGTYYPYIPIIGLFVNIGFTCWVYLFLLVALIVSKKRRYILILLPALSFILVCVAGPANTYFRYSLPYIMPLPMTVCLLYYVFQKKEVDDKI